MEKHTNPEVVIVGAGIGGSALATVLARAGIAVTLLEKSLVHVDHVRGEWLKRLVGRRWKTQRLGLYETLLAAGGHHLARHIAYSDDIDPATAESQLLDMTAFANAGFKPPLCMRHPDMCDLLNAEAIKAGAELLRGVTDPQVTAGAAPEVRFRHDGVERKFNPRIVIGADGRNSVVRGQVGIDQHRDPTHHLMAGMLVDNTTGWPSDLQIFGTEARVNFLAFPQSADRVRLYICYATEDKRRFAGADNQARFLDAFHLASVPWQRVPGGTAPRQGPAIPVLATWRTPGLTQVAQIFCVVLIGDAAGHNDPIIGQGLSIAYRDVRIVRDLMLENRSWTPDLFQPYAEERRERMRRLRLTASTFSILSVEFGDRARARRAKVREERLRGNFPDVSPAAFIGPEVLPAEMFDEATLDRLRAM